METNKELIDQLREYAGNAGYSHQDYADTMLQAAAALSQRSEAVDGGNMPSTPDEVVGFVGSNFDARDERGEKSDWRFTLSVHDLLSSFEEWSDRAAPAPSAAAGEQVDWMECERISNDDHVDEALRTFSDDPTQDNATGVIQAAITVYNADRAALATHTPPAQGDAVPVATKCAACNGEGWVRDIHDMEQGRIRCTKCATRQSSADAVDALSMKLPCDVTIGGVTIRAGCKLSTLITRFTSIHRMAMEYAPKADPAFVEKIRKIVSGEHEQ